MPRKESKKGKPKAKTGAEKKPASSELSEEQLERVAGGASDMFLKLDGIKGETTEGIKTPIVVGAVTDLFRFKRT